MEIRVKIQGIEELRNAFKRSPMIVRKHINKAIAGSIFAIEREAKLKAPVDTGRLRASIGGGGFRGGSFPEGHGRVLRDFYGEIGSDVHYAIHQEFGTRFQSGTPFLRPGVKTATPNINRFFDEAIKNIATDLSK